MQRLRREKARTNDLTPLPHPTEGVNTRQRLIYNKRTIQRITRQQRMVMDIIIVLNLLPITRRTRLCRRASPLIS